jgi:hypothetical protein
VLVCEGAGSPTEINLRAHDYVNMGLARHAGMPVVVVGDIDRGGLYAALYGTVALLEPCAWHVCAALQRVLLLAWSLTIATVRSPSARPS